MSISFVSERDVLLIKAIEERVGGEMPKLEEAEGVREKTVVEVLKEVGEAKRIAVMGMDEEGWEEKSRKRKR
jgi:formylmethanofuran dehydrogenase subunit B